MTDLLNIPITTLKGTGPKTISRLEKLGLFTVQDLLFHLPFRYEDRTKILPIRSLKIGESAGIIGTIEDIEIIRFGRPMLLCGIRDLSGYLQLRFFNFEKQKLQFRLKRGTKIYCYGELRFAGRTPEMTHPDYKILAANEEPALTKTLTPIYPTTEGLPQLALRKLITQSLNIAAKTHKLSEYLPETVLTHFKFPNLFDALCFVHEPPEDVNITAITERNHPMRRRLIFEELLAHQLSLLKLRTETQIHPSYTINWDDTFASHFQKTLPFCLTRSQQEVLQEIKNDITQKKPMLRLVQGDVGCGKTVVAAATIIHAIKNGFQAAIMAPTEILAEQHLQTFTMWLAPLNINLVLLTGKITGKKRAKIAQAIEDGSAQLIVGTHAIFQEKINFKTLALIIIDEQHRFGVHQRLQLHEKGLKTGLYPHQLIMTATPIPRTLAMTIYADLDCSIINELPQGRAKITTIIVSNKRRQEIITRINDNCKSGKQAYWVCPLIEESENLQCQAAETLAGNLKIALPNLRIGLVHGRMKVLEKEKTMTTFKNHEIDLLVATTVIEVGVDVPNASLMIIENAERLGLVQLHQLRGRVGRGKIASHCVLLYQTPLSQQAEQRLAFLRANHDGFALAKKDLEMRGAGEVLGTKQTGIMQFRIADLILDQHLIPEVQKIASFIAQKHHHIIAPIITRWLGAKEKYGKVI